MVTFKLIEETEPMLMYYYFPEGRENKKPGIIVIDRITGEIKISELAEDDSERDILPEELNEMAKRINQTEQEHGGTDFVEMVTEPVHYTIYGDHAVRKIVDSLNKRQIPKQGMAAWC